MVLGLNTFRDYFADDTDKYVLIGGAACDIVFTIEVKAIWSRTCCLKKNRFQN